jgi:hypothetical protein
MGVTAKIGITYGGKELEQEKAKKAKSINLLKQVMEKINDVQYLLSIGIHSGILDVGHGNVSVGKSLLGTVNQRFLDEIAVIEGKAVYFPTLNDEE